MSLTRGRYRAARKTLSSAKDLKMRHPELYVEVFNEGKREGQKELSTVRITQGAATERARIESVYKACSVDGRLIADYEALIGEMLFDGKTTGEMATARLVAAWKKDRWNTFKEAWPC